MRTLRIGSIWAFILLIVNVYSQKVDSISGYKGLEWGSSIDYVKTNYGSPLKPCEEEIDSTVINNGEYCLVEEIPNGLITMRSFYFYDGKFYKVSIIYSDEGIKNFNTIKDSYFKDFGKTKHDQDSSVLTYAEFPMLKLPIKIEAWIWNKQNGSISLIKQFLTINDKAKIEYKKILRDSPEFQTMALQMQEGGYSPEAFETLVLNNLFKTYGGTKLIAQFESFAFAPAQKNENRSSNSKNEDKY